MLGKITPHAPARSASCSGLSKKSRSPSVSGHPPWQDPEIDLDRIDITSDVSEQAPTTKAARPERDVLTEYLADIKQYESRLSVGMIKERATHEWLRETAQHFYVSGDFSNAGVTSLLSRLHSRTLFLTDSSLATTTKSALTKICGRERSEQPALSEYFENTFGRFYESRIAELLVKNPSPAIMRTGVIQADFLQEHFEHLFATLPQREHAAFFDALVGDISSYRRQWFGKAPAIGRFLQHPSAEILWKTIAAPEDGFAIIRNQYMTVKIATCLRDFHVKDRWLKDADAFYYHISEARMTRSAETTVATKQHGTRLPHHPPFKAEADAHASWAYSWAAAKTPFFREIDTLLHRGAETFEGVALLNGHPVVNGLSGSANVLCHVNNQIAKQRAEYSAKQAQIMTLMFLTYDGGHSFIESMAVHEVLRSAKERGELPDDPTVYENRIRLIEKYQLDYHDIQNLLPEGSERDAMRSIFLRAIDDSVEHFEKYGYRNPSVGETRWPGESPDMRGSAPHLSPLDGSS